MFEKLAKIIEGVVGDSFTGQDYDNGWNDAIKRTANKLADHFKSENRFFDRQAFLKACGFSVEPNWKAVPYNDKTQLSNQFAVATIVDGNGDIVANVFCQEAAALIETAPELKKKLSEYEGKD